MNLVKYWLWERSDGIRKYGFDYENGLNLKKRLYVSDQHDKKKGLHWAGLDEQQQINRLAYF